LSGWSSPDKSRKQRRGGGDVPPTIAEVIEAAILAFKSMLTVALILQGTVGVKL
jgi:hypothetical protein